VLEELGDDVRLGVQHVLDGRLHGRLGGVALLAHVAHDGDDEGPVQRHEEAPEVLAARLWAAAEVVGPALAEARHLQRHRQHAGQAHLRDARRREGRDLALLEGRLRPLEQLLHEVDGAFLELWEVDALQRRKR
jgi:hypothetical protein